MVTNQNRLSAYFGNLFCFLSFFEKMIFFVACKKSTKNTHKKKQQNNTQCQTIANIPLALMKQFNLFPNCYS